MFNLTERKAAYRQAPHRSVFPNACHNIEELNHG